MADVANTVANKANTLKGVVRQCSPSTAEQCSPTLAVRQNVRLAARTAIRIRLPGPPMSRRPANITQADIAHAIRTADQATTNRHVSEVSRLIEMAYCRLSPDLMMENLRASTRELAAESRWISKTPQG
jgi:hypothetical protein